MSEVYNKFIIDSETKSFDFEGLEVKANTPELLKLVLDKVFE